MSKLRDIVVSPSTAAARNSLVYQSKNCWIKKRVQMSWIYRWPAARIGAVSYLVSTSLVQLPTRQHRLLSEHKETFTGWFMILSSLSRDKIIREPVTLNKHRVSAAGTPADTRNTAQTTERRRRTQRCDKYRQLPLNPQVDSVTVVTKPKGKHTNR